MSGNGYDEIGAELHERLYRRVTQQQVVLAEIHGRLKALEEAVGEFRKLLADGQRIESEERWLERVNTHLEAMSKGDR